MFNLVLRVKNFLKSIVFSLFSFARPALIRLFSSKWMLKYYYMFISSAFREEQSKVLSGISRFIADDCSYKNEYSLRRNIHRIEKGMVMRPRRDCFAVEYILHTVHSYRKVCFNSNVDRALIAWAHDVLELYFSCSNGSNNIDLAREVFYSCPPVDKHSVKSIPVIRSAAPLLTMRYNDFFVLAQRRRSVRWYTSSRVQRELIDKALQVAAYSPSACNRQPFEFRVFDDEALVRKVMSIPGGTSGWSQSPPVAVVLVGHLNAFVEERDRHLIYIDSSLSAMSFMFALESLGLSSCAINFPDIPNKNLAIAQLLGLAAHEVVIMIIALGYADVDSMVPFSGKKSLDTFRNYNKIS